MKHPDVPVPLNYNAVTDRLWVGSRPTDAADVRRLIDAGVSHVLNVCDVDDPPSFTHYLWNPTADDGAPKTAEWFQPSIRFGIETLSTEGNVLYVHCFDGYDRSVVSVYAILRAWGLTNEQAETLCKMARPLDWFNPQFAAYCRDAEAALTKGW